MGKQVVSFQTLLCVQVAFEDGSVFPPLTLCAPMATCHNHTQIMLILEKQIASSCEVFQMLYLHHLGVLCSEDLYLLTICSYTLFAHGRKDAQFFRHYFNCVKLIMCMQRILWMEI